MEAEPSDKTQIQLCIRDSDDIAALEARIEKLDAEIMANATNSGKLNELTQQKTEAEAQLEEKMDRWMYLNDLAEQIEAQNNN